jgi:hypothetical protein
VIGDRAFAFRRAVRPGDFRASGSGIIDYDVQAIDLRCVRIAFEVAQKLGTQSLAFDFIYDHQGTPLIAEISYSYMPSAIFACSGYWDSRLNWHDEQVWPQDAILEDVLASLGGRSK